MRWLTLARYRYLVSVRKAHWIFASLLVVVGLAVVLASALLIPTSWFEQNSSAAPQSAITVLMIYLIQAFGLGFASLAFGTTTRRAETSTAADLLDTAPVSPQSRFWGDAVGIFATQVAIHVALLPIFAVAFAVSPWPVRGFVYLELSSLLVFFFTACHASWLLRGATSRWSRTRAARSAAIFGILLLTILISTTRWEDLLYGWVTLMSQVDPRAIHTMTEAFDNPALSVLLLTLLYGGFIAFYFLHSVRTMEKA
jgi:hypothetical protein